MLLACSWRAPGVLLACLLLAPGLLPLFSLQTACVILACFWYAPGMLLPHGPSPSMERNCGLSQAVERQWGLPQPFQPKVPGTLLVNVLG